MPSVPFLFFTKYVNAGSTDARPKASFITFCHQSVRDRSMMRHGLTRGTASAIILDYVDGKGERSTRSVMPLAILIGDGKRSTANTYLQARCSVQRAVRSFRFDRIGAVSDAATGESWPVEAWAKRIPVGQGKSVVAFDEVDEAPAAEDPFPLSSAQTSRLAFWRAIAIATLIGYAVGRLRILHMLLHALHVRHALWL